MVDISVDEKDNILYDVDQAQQSVNAWKSHLLRNINQYMAKLPILEKLDAPSVLLIQDWAMK